MKRTGYLYAALSAATYGLIPLFIVPVQQAGFTLDKTLFFRFFLSFLMVGGYLLYQKTAFRMYRKEALVVIGLGLLYALSAESLFLAYDYLSAGIASTILYAYPLIVAVLMAAFFREKMKRTTWVALGLTSIGVMALCVKDSLADIPFGGLCIAFSSALFYALYMILVNQSKLRLSSLEVTLYSLLFSAVYYGLKMLIRHDSWAIDAAFLLNSSVFALVTTVLSLLCLIRAIERIGSTQTSIMGALEPVVAVLVSVAIFHETFSFYSVLGMLFILSGVLLNIIVGQRNQ